MRLNSVGVIICLLCVTLFRAHDQRAVASESSMTPLFGSLNIPFIANEGQVSDRVIFYARTFGATVFITEEGDIVYVLPVPEKQDITGEVVLVESAVGTSIEPIRGDDPVETCISSFRGNDPAEWHSGIGSYECLNFGEVYDGIELVLQAHGNTVEKVFSVTPGADPQKIVMKIEEADHLRIDPSGELVVETAAGPVTFTKPTAYQEMNGTRISIEVAYRLDGNEYGFLIGDYDDDWPLVIDPLLASTFLGGGSIEGGDEYWWIWTDLGPDGSVYVAGMTSSSDFPVTPGSYDESFHGNYDVFVSRLDRDLTTLLAATYIGGNTFDRCWDIVVADDGNVYVSGMTQSSDFPTTIGAYDRNRNGSGDAFVSKLSADLSALVASTYLGGNGYEGRPKIALDGDGHLFVTGTTDHSSFPVTSGAYDESYNGGSDDFFISKFDSGLTSLLSSTFLGGIYHEWWPSIAIDDSNTVYVSGSSGSYNFPVTSTAYDTSFNGSQSHGQWNLDVFISRLNNNLTSLLASTFIGADDYEGCLHLLLDEAENVYVCGHTWDQNYPRTSGVLDEAFSGDEYFISKLDGTLSSLLASTFTTPDDAGLGHVWDMKADGRGSLYLVGPTVSSDFFVTSNAYDVTFNGGYNDAFLMRIDDNLTTILYSTFLGGSGKEGISTIVIDENGDAYIAGYTDSAADFPISRDAYDDTYNGGSSDCFVAKFTFHRFTRIIEGPHVTDGGSSQGISWVDYDNDGYLDLFVSNLIWPTGQDNWLYRNTGNGTFDKITDGDMVNDRGKSRTSTWGDCDNDGDLDCFVSNWPEERNFLYLNDGDGTFTKVTTGEIVNEVRGSPAAAWGDYDNDGDVDLFVANYGTNSLFRNDGLSFTKITDGEIATDVSDSYSAAWADYDNDGDLDLFVTSNYVDLNNYLYRNNGNGTFNKITGQNIVSDGGESFGGSWGDYDNDGDLDLFVPNICYSTVGNNFLYNNNGDGTFTRITEGDIVNDGGYSFGSAWGDYDNDGDLDLFVANYPHQGRSRDFLYENNGHGTFSAVTDESLVTDEGASYGAAWGDYDRDGDLDLMVAKFANSNENNALYKNNGNSNNWINIRCIGTLSNMSAIGAKIRLNAVINSSPHWQLREISAQTGYCSQNSLNAHFGLGDAVVIDSIKIEWPSGMVDILTEIEVNQFLTVTEGEYGDLDGDGIVDTYDNCPNHANPEQEDGDTDGVGDSCDNCLEIYNPDQGDADVDSIGDVCDPCTDTDGDGYGDPGFPASTCNEDNCPGTYNPDQADFESGDINCEGGINVLDVLAVVNHILGTSTLFGAPLDRADCNRDASVNILDALSIVNIILGLIPECPGSAYKPEVTPEVVFFCQSLKAYLSPNDHEKFMSLVKAEMAVPHSVFLSQNYPNPFNPETEIRFGLPDASRVTLTVFNLLGQTVEVVIDSDMEAGCHTVPWNASGLPCGVYFYRLQTGNFRAVRKMALIK